ncbi:MAG TPA: class I SAM-dependent methyltransferase [Mycobacteriales bacterium]|jgi:SAM-dependent methyltransferase|nr:class I SAM-dependent methyltransferase [Mycobacteriales bacterium]
MTTPAQRRAFLDERRAASARRYDELHAPSYDEHWGDIDPTHRACVDRLVASTPDGGLVVDAACGTGKYWPQLLAAGRRVLGLDQSAGMLARALAKHPDVPTRVLALQDLARAPELAGIADGLICVDALENVGPEDWPRVLGGLAAVLRPGAPAYLTVELPEEPLPAPVDPRQVAGELFAGGGYHYYPDRDRVRGWLAGAGFGTVAQADGDGYWHLLVRGPGTGHR